MTWKIMLAGVAIAVAVTGSALAGANDYVFEPVKTEVKKGDGVIVSVADTGTGIASQDLERIFNPLFTTKSGGMGMGLAICRSIIEAHDGRLWVAPNKPEGAVFQFTLLADDATSAGASQGEPPDDIPPSSRL